MIIVSEKITLEEKDFGHFNKNVVLMLINSVKDFFAEVGVNSSKSLVVKHQKGAPECRVVPGSDLHVIFLTVEEDDWGRWTYEFAHEFCHHLINGSLVRGTAGLRWFEESLCHVASYACLDRFIRKCAENKSLTNNVWHLINYLQNYLSDCGDRLYDSFMPDLQNPKKFEPIPQSFYIPLQTYIKKRQSVLESDYVVYAYQYISRALFPHFYNNKKLWEILSFIGDTMEQTSLENLYNNLKQQVGDECKQSLDDMMACLI